MTQQEVKLFTHSACTDSSKVRAWLKDHNIPFIERQVDNDPDALKELQNTGAFATPLLVKDDMRLIGYRPRRLNEIFQVEQ